MSRYPLTQNEYGFDVSNDNPFIIFKYLREVADASVGVENVLDLSRGDPGYGFAPNVRSRRFYSFLVALDTAFNSFDEHFKDKTAADTDQILARIRRFACETYTPAVAELLLADLDEFVARVIAAAKNCALDWAVFDVLFHLFKYATVSGGCYHDPAGELLARVVVADMHQKNLGVRVRPHELLFTNGASHAIGDLFKAMGPIGMKYLQKGDPVVITSPVYFPYMGILEERGMDIHIASTDPESGKLVSGTLDRLAGTRPKVIFLVDPDNPTGFAKDEASLREIAAFAEAEDAIIVADEVYAQFHPDKKSILAFAPRRTIRIDARSKIERATGCRFGEFLVTDEANDYLSKKLKTQLGGTDLRTYLGKAKAPGGVKGEFTHTTFVGGPGQLLSACHIVLGDTERARYVDLVRENTQLWHETLGIPYRGNLYYSLFDMQDIASPGKRELRAERKLLDLAKRGVVLIPSNLFFCSFDRKSRDRTNYLRASLPNLTTEQVKKAALTVREYLAK